MFCPEHSPKPDPTLAEKPLDEFVSGSFVKLGFDTGLAEGPCTEHLWVKVVGPGDRQELKGTIDNDPFFLDYVTFGEMVEFDREDVEQFLGVDDT